MSYLTEALVDLGHDVTLFASGDSQTGGRPVIAFNRGSVPEVVDDGLTGFIVEDEQGAIGAVDRLSQLSREKIRTQFERRFTARRMALEYLAAYRTLMERAAPRLRLVAEDVAAEGSGSL